MKKQFFTLALILVSGFTLLAGDIYVDKNYTGTDSDGSETKPYPTIQEAVQAAATGSVIYIKAGVYREQVEIDKDDLTFMPYNNDKVVVTGTEAMVNMTHVSGSVYKATVDWDISEGGQNNQVFVDGKMIHLARWPKETGDDLIVNPTLGYMDGATKSGDLVTFQDADFTEPAERWKGAQIWLNSSEVYNNHGWDGDGFTGQITNVSGTSLTIKSIGEQILNAGDDEHYAAKNGTEYYLFNPTQSAVDASGGVTSLLGSGEWWKSGNILYIRLPNDGTPASSEDSSNLVEVKKRIWAFAPTTSKVTMSNITIKNIEIHGASITTDRNYASRTDDVANANNNVFDGITFRYVFHTTDLTGYHHKYWMQRSGVILSGNDNIIQNCTFDYSATAAISAIGYRHKILYNKFTNINYHVMETGTICAGKDAYLYDAEIGYNTFINCPHKAIALVKTRCSDPTYNPGSMRMHHNLIDGYCLRAHDCGAFNASAGEDWTYLRIDHNHIFNGPLETTWAIYFDFGAHAIIDHNVVDAHEPMLFNIFKPGQGPRGPFYVYNNVAKSHGSLPAIKISDRDNTGDVMYLKNNIVSRFSGNWYGAVRESNLTISDETEFKALFEDFDNRNFQLKSTATTAIDQGVSVLPYNDPKVGSAYDIGAYEFNGTPWHAGVSTSSAETIMDKPYWSVHVFPNPANDNLNIHVNIEDNPLKDKTVTLRLYDIQGKLVHEKQHNAATGIINHKIDVSNLPSGLYLLNLNGKPAQKILID